VPDPGKINIKKYAYLYGRELKKHASGSGVEARATRCSGFAGPALGFA
jgi:hypothetical protein